MCSSKYILVFAWIFTKPSPLIIRTARWMPPDDMRCLVLRTTYVRSNSHAHLATNAEPNEWVYVPGQRYRWSRTNVVHWCRWPVKGILHVPYRPSRHFPFPPYPVDCHGWAIQIHSAYTCFVTWKSSFDGSLVPHLPEIFRTMNRIRTACLGELQGFLGINNTGFRAISYWMELKFQLDHGIMGNIRWLQIFGWATLNLLKCSC